MPFSRLLLLLILTLTACESGSREETSTKDLHQFPEEILTECEESLFPALFYLPETSLLFKNKNLLTGQHPTEFKSLLSETEKDEIITGFRNRYTSSDSTGKRFYERYLQQWCFLNNQSSNPLFANLSMEEILAMIYSHSSHSDLFDPFSDRAMFQIENIEPIDRVSTLSSAESFDLFSRWITKTAMMPDQEFREELSRVTQTARN